MTSLVRLLLVAAVIAVAGAGTPGAWASQLIDRNATHVSLNVNAKGEALLVYTAAGQVRHVIAWDAVDAVPPTRSRAQVKFQLDYAGGFGKYKDGNYWQTSFNGSCLPYDGPALPWKVLACKGPDGSYWALQAWQRELPDYGVKPTPQQSVSELRLAHWRGALPVLEITTDWSYRKYEHLFGTLTFGGVGVYGFKSTSAGVPLDTFGRNIYVDTFNSAYGSGWTRENSFLTHGPGGSFCYGFYPHGPHPAGNGARYRITVIGPGVAPDPMWQGTSPGPYDTAADATANDAQLTLHDPKCGKA